MIPSTMTWAIIKAIYETFFPVVITCVVNQCHGYWLFSNALVSTIRLHVKLEKERLDI
jgi:hypothetical protein